jgi:cyclopropane-fatty-acyl-phospholipid synthase
MQLGPGNRVLEIGGGWGGFALHAATKYGCHVTTTTISERQHEYMRRRIRSARLEHLVDVRADDYRDLRGTFDKAIAIEMIEAVNWRGYDDFFAQCRNLLRDDGSLGMQAIVVPARSFDRVKRGTDFIKAAIFPGGCLPSVEALTVAAARSDFARGACHEIGRHYPETLRRWRSNLATHLPELAALGFDERFTRLWDFYFSYCEAGFEEDYLGDVQLLYTLPARASRTRCSERLQARREEVTCLGA